MVNRHKLAQELANLKERDWFAVLREARDKRIEREDKRKEPEEPKPGMPPERVAAWTAWHHLAVDPELIKVMYLPANAPENELRLMEIFDYVVGPQSEPVEPLDMSPVSSDVDFKVLVADITSEQWKRIRKGEPLLPAGWCLDGAKTFRRGKPG